MIVSNWNSCVKSSDTVYHLGDFSLGSNGPAYYLKQLNGHINLVFGNHDDPRIIRKCGFVLAEKTRLLRFRFPDQENRQYVWLSHFAHRVWDRSHYGSWHLYGHSHGKLPPMGLSMDVGIDARLSWNLPGESNRSSMRPWSLDEIRTIMEGRAQHG